MLPAVAVQNGSGVSNRKRTSAPRNPHREASMTEWTPVRTVADLATLDETEILEGYRDGLENAPEPGNNRSRSYWHGWRNGMADKGRRPIDAAQMQLAREYVSRARPA